MTFRGVIEGLKTLFFCWVSQGIQRLPTKNGVRIVGMETSKNIPAATDPKLTSKSR